MVKKRGKKQSNPKQPSVEEKSSDPSTSGQPPSPSAPRNQNAADNNPVTHTRCQEQKVAQRRYEQQSGSTSQQSVREEQGLYGNRQFSQAGYQSPQSSQNYEGQAIRRDNKRSQNINYRQSQKSTYQSPPQQGGHKSLNYTQKANQQGQFGTSQYQKGDSGDRPINLARDGQKSGGSRGASAAAGSTGAPDKVQSGSLKSNAEAKKQDPLKIEELPYCKKTAGTSGYKKITVLSNHFALNLGKLKTAYQYAVNITENDSKNSKEPSSKITIKERGKVSRNRKIKDKVKVRVVKEFLKRHFPERYPAFDGSQILYASRPLGDNLGQIEDMDIEVFDDLNKKKSFKIEIQFTKQLDLTPQPATDKSPEVFLRDVHQLIEVVLRNAPALNFTQIGRGFFRKPDDRVIPLGGGMEMYYGFSQSVVLGGRWEKVIPFLNLHLSHKAFPKNIKVLDAFLEIIDGRRTGMTYQDLTQLKSWQRQSINNYISSLKVSYQVPNFPKMTYRVNGLKRNPREEKLNTGVTVFDYFRNEKKYTIVHDGIPLLWVGSKKQNILVPPELCVIEKDQSVKKKLDKFQTRSMILESATDTKIHRQNTLKRLSEAKFDESLCLKEFGFSVSDKFAQTEARILPPPQIQYKNGVSEVTKGVWYGKKFYDAKTVSKWAIVNLEVQSIRRSDLEKLVHEIKSAASTFGVEFLAYPEFLHVNTKNTTSRTGPTLNDLEMFFERHETTGYDVIFVILPFRNSDEAYSNIKHAAEILIGCLTQCLKPETVQNINKKTAENILLKLNAKLDGTNHVLSHVTKPICLKEEEPVMILGADVTHPPPQSELPCSIAAIVASHDPTGLFHYNLTIRLQERNMEYILDMKNVIKEQLMYFLKKNNGIKPEKIIYFRDGVSDGQFAMVKAIELKAIFEACKEVQKEDYVPKITFVVVQKRHHTRLFPLNDRDSEDQGFPRKPGNFNVPAGTCVDTNIVNPGIQNFYLLSHGSIKGVSRPTKYTTVYDDMDLSNDEIQELAYYLCHMFARCNRSVSYPAPTYYAHLGALRGKAYINATLAGRQFDICDLNAEMKNIETKFCIKDNNPMFFV